MSFVYKDYYKENEEGKAEIICPQDFNFAYDVMDCLAQECPDSPALLHRSAEGKDSVFSFGEMKHWSDKAANALRSLGIGKGDAVMLLLKRRYEYWISILALHKLGAIAIPTSHMVSAEDIRERVQAAEAKAVICVNSEHICDKVKEALDGSAVLQLSVGEAYEGAQDLNRLMEAADDAFERVATDCTDPMLYYFTSGTNGAPKAVIHDFSYPLAHIYTAKNWHGILEGDRHLTVADSGWAKSAWGKLYGQWFMAATVMVYDYEQFYAADMLRFLEEEKVNTFCAPPTVYKYLLLEDPDKYDLRNLRCATTAGEPMPGEVARRFEKMYGIAVREGFGQTETALQICTPVGETGREGSVGKASPMYHVELVDEENRVVAAGEEGEIVILPDGEKSLPGVFKGYLGEEERYAEIWRGGIYHTGDMAYRDEDGYFFFLGRNDDVIKSSGYRIGPSEVEDILMRHPAVFECAVTGYPSAKRGTVVKASIILKEGIAAEESLKTQLQDFVKERAAIYKYPRMIEFVKELPRSSSGKINRCAIRRRDMKKC